MTEQEQTRRNVLTLKGEFERDLMISCPETNWNFAWDNSKNRYRADCMEDMFFCYILGKKSMLNNGR